MKFTALAIAAVAIVSLSAPASAQVYGSMNVGVGVGLGHHAPYYAPRASYRGAYYEEGYVASVGRRGGNPYMGRYDYSQVRSVRIEPELPAGKFRCDARTGQPAYPGTAWCVRPVR